MEEKIKKIAIKRGVYKPPTGVKANTYTSPNVKTNVDVNYKPTSSTSMKALVKRLPIVPITQSKFASLPTTAR